MPIEQRDVARFRRLLRRLTGLQLDAAQAPALAGLLEAEVGRRRLSPSAYLKALAGAPEENIARLAQDLTVSETSFFRNAEHMAAFEALLAASRGRPLRILSAGCASGEEPYSLAMIARLCGGDAGLSFQAFDINAAGLRRAAEGRYSSWSLRQTPAPARARFFRREGASFVLEESVKRMVAFSRRNLAAADDGFWQVDSFDIVFCRNVLMYFTPRAARAVVARIAGALKPGGFLFLGHAETLRGLSDAFRLQHAHGTFYYCRKDGGREISAGAPRASAMPACPQQFALEDASWYDDILRAAARVRALADGSSAAAQGEAKDG